MSPFEPDPPERRRGSPTDRTLFQNAWVVDDVEATAHRWATELGVGPFFVTEYVDTITDVEYRGRPGELQMIVALAQAGPVQIELIQPTSGPSAYRDSVPEGSGVGFHHVCTWSHDLDADIDHLVSQGYDLVNRAKAGGRTPIAYVDTRPLLGAMFELVTHHPVIQERFEAIAAVCATWDGAEPVRDMARL